MKKFFAFSLLFLSGACSTGLGTRNVNQEAISKVKKVAFVAFDVRGPEAIGHNNEAQEDLKEIYNDFANTLKEKSSWNILKLENFQGSAGYKTAFDETMKGFQSKGALGLGNRLYTMDSLMDAESPRVLSFEKRKQLIAALGVQAIVSLRVEAIINSVTVMGMGSRKVGTRLHMTVYSAEDEAPIFFDSNIEGPVNPNSLGMIGIYKISDLLSRAKVSAKEAGLKLQIR